MTYARARLLLGVSGVGFFVIAAATALWFDLPHSVFAGSSLLRTLFLTLTAYILLSFPFDLLGGYLLPRRFDRTRVQLPAFLRFWLQGVVAQALVMALCAVLILEAARWGGAPAGIAMFLLLMLCLLEAQLPVARLVGALKPSSALPPAPVPRLAGKTPRQPAIFAYQSTDPAFVGGVVGLPGNERLLLPAAWLASLPAEVVTMQLIRRLGAITTGARTRGLGVALVWNLLGFVLASQLPRANLVDAAGLINAGLWFTLWSFLGLLLLPTVNRPGVLEADHYGQSHGIGAETMERGMIELDRLQDDEPRRSRWIERVFHPIPSVEKRLEALDHTAPRLGAWQGARTTLYLSWAFFGFLSRAVHCNVGRPQLWVLFPGD